MKKISKKPAKSTKSTVKNEPFVIVRCTQAGVHAGYLVKQTKDKVYLRDSRRIWYWSGAASLSEIAVYGLNPAKSSASKIAAKVDVELYQRDCCEILKCTEAGKASVEGMPEWRA